MIVCHCRALSDRTIRAVIQGCEDEQELVQRCGAGGKCGGCVPALRRLIAEHRLHNWEPEPRTLAPA